MIADFFLKQYKPDDSGATYLNVRGKSLRIGYQGKLPFKNKDNVKFFSDL